MNKKVYVDLSQQDVQDIINAYEKDIEKFNKQKEVLDKIKELMNNTPDTNYSYDYVILKNEIYKLLEEIE